MVEGNRLRRQMPLECCEILILASAMKNFFLVLIISCLAGCGDSNIQVTKSADPQRRENHYTASSGWCRLVWRVSKGKEFGVGQDSSHCALPPSKLQPLWDALLHKLIEDTNNLQGIVGFYWGALNEAGSSNEFSERLMRAAARSREWDKQRGVVLGHPHNTPNALVKKLLVESNAFAELSETFAKHNFRLQVLDVEEVLTQTVDTKEFGTVTVPYSCLIWFSVVPMLK